MTAELMTRGWKKIESLTVGERHVISEIIYDSLCDAGFRPLDMNWNIEVKFFNDLEDE